MLSGFFSKWKNILTQFVEDRVRMAQLEFIDKTANVLGYLLFIIASLIFGFGFLILFGLGLAELFTHLFNDNKVAGYFTAAGVYLLLTVLLIAFHKPFSERIASIFIRILTSQKEEDPDKK